MNFPIDLKKFKKISSDHSSTVLQHPLGHKITVAHKALGEDMRKQLHDIPHMYSGGEMSSESPQMPFNININPSPLMSPSPQIPDQVAKVAQNDNPYADEYQNTFKMQRLLNPGEPESVSQGTALSAAERKLAHDENSKANEAYDKEQEDKAKVAKESDIAKRLSAIGVQTGTPVPQEQGLAQPANNEGSPVVPQNPDPYGFGAQSDAMLKGYNEQRAGLMQEAQAQGALGKAQAGIEQEGAQQSQNLMDTFNKQQSGLLEQRQHLQEAISNGKIDPNKYIHNMSTGAKVGTAIGLLLGGIGGALTNQENPALKVINAQIDRDIDAQKTDLGKKQGLLDANYKDLGNLKDAMTMTKIMQTDIISQRLKSEAAKAQDPLVKANALKAAGALDMQMAPLVQQMAVRRSMMSGAAQSGRADPATMIQFMAPEGEKQHLFKDLQDAQNTMKFRDNLLAGFDQLAKINTLGNRAAHLGFTPPSVKAIRDPLIAQFSKDTAGRFTEADAGYISPLLDLEGNGDSSVADKRRQLVKFAEQKMNFPSLKFYGFNPNSKYAEGGQKTIQLGAPVVNGR